MHVGELPKKLQWAELHIWFLQNWNASWVVTANILKFMQHSSLSPPLSKWIARPWKPELRQLGRGTHWVPIPRWDLVGEGRGPVPPANLLVQETKKTKQECCSVWLLLPHHSGQLITNKMLEKPVIVGSLGSCILLMALIDLMSWYLLISSKMWTSWGTDEFYNMLNMEERKWDPSAGLKCGLLLKDISEERANRTLLVVFLFMALCWRMKTNFPYFSRLYCFDRLLSF